MGGGGDILLNTKAMSSFVLESLMVESDEAWSNGMVVNSAVFNVTFRNDSFIDISGSILS